MPNTDIEEAAVIDLIPDTEFDTRAGVIVGAHGVQGTVKIKPVTGTSYRLFASDAKSAKGVEVWIGSDQVTGTLYTVLNAKKQEPKEIYLVRLRGIDDRTTADSMVGQSVYGKSVDRLPLSEDEFFVEDLIGLKVIDLNNVDLGQLAIVHSGVANDVYETDQGVMIPAVKAFIEKIDLESRTITVLDAAALTIE